MQPAILLYDGNCPMCLRARDWIAARIPPARIRLVPCQSAERAAFAPQVPEADCMAAMQLVLADGTVLAGERAFPPLLRMMPRYGILAAALESPGARHLAPITYRWVARHRMRISGLFRRKAAGESCSLDGDCR